MYISTTIYYTM